MSIGFSQRALVVSENMTLPGEDVFSHFIELSANRVSERDHEMLLVVEPITARVKAAIPPPNNLDFDALFGQQEDNNFTSTYTLPAGTSTIQPQRILIRNDIVPEEDEFLEIHVIPLSFGYRCRCLSFSCNFSTLATNYFCERLIVITDDDGKPLYQFLIEV